MKYIYWNILFVFLFFSCKQQEEVEQLDNEVQTEIPASAIQALESSEDLDRLLDEIGESRYVLLGEASHGTAEYYTWRAEISKRLIQEKGFTIIGVEGDWPDMYRLNQYIQGSQEHGATATEVLQQMDRWPTWMWANKEVAELGDWLHTYNQSKAANQQVGFYGIDVYSLWDSMEEVLSYLEQEDAPAAQMARDALACFSSYGQDEWSYANAAAYDEEKSCADELAALLTAVQQHAAAQPSGDEAAFNAAQNALVAVNAERYFTTATQSNSGSWNVRDNHMMETINRLVSHKGNEAKIIVWEHNTHIGDARATDMANAGMVNVGQLAREQHSEKGVYVVGFGSYEGTVIAASLWEGEMEVMEMPEAMKGSWEAFLHDIEPANKIIFLEELRGKSPFNKPIGHRAIGVAYNPGSEQGNYVPSILPERYDAFVFIDRTTALHPLGGMSGARIEKASLKSVEE